MCQQDEVVLCHLYNRRYISRNATVFKFWLTVMFMCFYAILDTKEK